MRRILTIDGGGLKGALPAAFLAEIEEATGKRIVDHFDLIAGTSTGGIIAIGLGLGIPARAILNFYVNEGSAVFRQDQPRLQGTGKGPQRAGKATQRPHARRANPFPLTVRINGGWPSFRRRRVTYRSTTFASAAPPQISAQWIS